MFYGIVAMFCKRQVVTGLAVRCDSDTCLQTCSSNVILRKLGFLNLNLRRTKTLPATEKCNEFVQDLNLSPEMEHAPKSPPPGEIANTQQVLGAGLFEIKVTFFNGFFSQRSEKIVNGLLFSDFCENRMIFVSRAH